MKDKNLDIKEMKKIANKVIKEDMKLLKELAKH